jgi:hypothetical protein
VPPLTFAPALASGLAFVVEAAAPDVFAPDVFVPDVFVLDELVPDVLVLGVFVLDAFVFDVSELGVFGPWAEEELELPLVPAEALVDACCAAGGGLAEELAAEVAAT